jgi:hypothetical protein
MPLTLARSICIVYAAVLAAFGLAMAMYPWNLLFVLGLWASAIGLVLRYRWAFWPAFAVAMLCLVQAAADATAARLPLRNLFRENLAHHYLLESPAQFFAWYGIPKPISQMALCMLALAALAWTHGALAKHGLLRPLADHDGKRLYVTIVSIVSKAILGIALLVIVYAVWKDPPTGGHNPGGPGPGMLAIYALFCAGPWVIAGAAGWGLTAWLRRRRRLDD